MENNQNPALHTGLQEVVRLINKTKRVKFSPEDEESSEDFKMMTRVSF